MTAPDLIIQSDTLTAAISPLGAELRRLTTRDGLDLQWNGDPEVWTGRAPILFPVIGVLDGGVYRLDGQTYAMPKHGFARHSTFAVVDVQPRSAIFRLSASDQTRPLYPFEFQLDLEFALDGPKLAIAATVANLGDAPMPASFGFHPALRWPLPFDRPRAEHRIVFEKDEPAPIRRIDADGLLTPQPHPTPVTGRTLALRDDLFVDDALIFDRLQSRRAVYGAESGPQLAVDFQDFAELGVWTKPGAGFICIEPWAGMADPKGFAGDFRNKPGVFEVAPGAGRRLAMSITLLPDSA
jgi:galactose mutarotase-like enzyme